MTYKQAYKFPLNWTLSKVFTADYNMAFDFMFHMMSGMFKREILCLDDVTKDNIVSLINGEKKGTIEGELKYIEEEGVITLDDKIIILMRGWGHLTGIGGLKLKPDVAAQLQKDFANHILKALKNDNH